MEELDPLIADAIQTRRDRYIIVVAAVVGILAGAILGTAAVLGLWGSFGGGPRSPAGLIFYAAPVAVCYGIGYEVHAIVRWRRWRRQTRRL